MAVPVCCGISASAIVEDWIKLVNTKGGLTMPTAAARPPAGRVRPGLRPAMLLAALALCPAAAPQAQPALQVPDTMEARLLACAACHGPQGRGTSNTYFPRLAGKPAGYLLNQLVAFRDGRRRYTPMNYLLEFQLDSYLQDMANYFAAQRPPLLARDVADVSNGLLDRGQALVLGGDPDHGIPACAGCHGPSFTGMEPAIPGLVGLQASYISAQLGAWRYGTRTAAAPDCMQVVAGHLTETDVTAVAAWLSALPIPADPAPSPQGTHSMPLPCGSEPLGDKP